MAQHHRSLRRCTSTSVPYTSSGESRVIGLNSAPSSDSVVIWTPGAIDAAADADAVADVRGRLLVGSPRSWTCSPKLDTTSDRKWAPDQHPTTMVTKHAHIARRVQGGNALMMRGTRAKNS